jgi:hypothetical protein
MIKCYLLDGESHPEGKAFKDFKEIKEALEKNQVLLSGIPTKAAALLIEAWGRVISADKGALKTEGAAYLSFYLKKDNVDKLIRCSVDKPEYLDGFAESRPGRFVKAQGRGVVCHWIAGNVKTLAVFSLVNSLLGRNANLIRVPEDIVSDVLRLLELLDGIKVEFEGETYSSEAYLRNTAIVHFDSNDRELNAGMSMAADARVIWGGEYAVKAISSLPKKTTCKDVVFGPRYSFAVMEGRLVSKACASQVARRTLMGALAVDIVQFGQNACSSPHVIFIEGTREQAEVIARSLGEVLERIGRSNPSSPGEAKASRIINERARYALSLDKDVLSSRDLSWTILLGSGTELEEPAGGRCIHIKNINDIMDLEKSVTKRVQTIGIESLDRERTFEFADRVSRRGADRIVSFGTMNAYDSPWDGTYLLGELVRWCSLNIAI